MSALLIALGVLGQWLPHAWNVAPLGAIGLFAGTHGSRRYALLVPLTVLALDDATRGFDPWIIGVGVYLGFAIGPIVGRCLLARRRSLPRFAAAVLASASAIILPG